MKGVPGPRGAVAQSAAGRWLLLAAAAGTAGVIALLMAAGGSPLEALKAVYHGLIPLEIREGVWEFGWQAARVVRKSGDVYASPWTYAILLGVFVLERVIPASRQRVFSAGLAQDFLWFNADALFKVVWLSVYLAWLRGVYAQHLGFLTVHAVDAWSLGARFAVSFLVFDFLNWLHHVIRHRVEALWYFHMVHHSQRQMNVFTDARVHLVEYFVSRTIIFIPLLMFQVKLGTIFWLALVMDWYTRVYHANLRTNYGVLKHVLVTPQSHQIHHSTQREHYDKNFGLFLTVWDRMFGTLHARYDEYPETGVDDETFPLEDMVVGLGVFRVYGAQLLYPFRRLLRRPRPVAGGVS